MEFIHKKKAEKARSKMLADQVNNEILLIPVVTVMIQF